MCVCLGGGGGGGGQIVCKGGRGRATAKLVRLYFMTPVCSSESFCFTILRVCEIMRVCMRVLRACVGVRRGRRSALLQSFEASHCTYLFLFLALI